MKSTGNERTGTVLERRGVDALGKGEEHIGLGKAMKDDDGTGNAGESRRTEKAVNGKARNYAELRRSMDRQEEDT